MSDIAVTGEASNSKLVAVFDHQESARAAAASAVARLSLQQAQVRVLAPGATDVGIQLEPEGGGIRRTIVVAHVWLGLAGMVAGGLLFVLLIVGGVAFVVESPWAAGLAMVGFGGIAGLLLGGLVSLRPDHDPYIHATRDALAAGRTAVVVHALSARQRTAAAECLAALGGKVTQTL
ncbi:MAG: hypothetical protein KF823_01205 [Xanthomonadales bacterium]|nr:hypothetical protein [Xanthomonadales bacterium]